MLNRTNSRVKNSNGVNYKKINFTFLIALLVASFVLGGFALAEGHITNTLGGIDTTADAANLSKTRENLTPTIGLTTLLGVAINYLFGAVAIIFFTIILIGGYVWMTARGSQEQIDRAKKFIINGIFGMVVIFLSYALVTVVLFFLDKSTK